MFNPIDVCPSSLLISCGGMVNLNNHNITAGINLSKPCTAATGSLLNVYTAGTVQVTCCHVEI